MTARCGCSDTPTLDAAARRAGTTARLLSLRIAQLRAIDRFTDAALLRDVPRELVAQVARAAGVVEATRGFGEA